MSFSHKIKSDLSRLKIPVKECCKAATLYGILLFCGRISHERIKIASDNIDVLDLTKSLLFDVAGIRNQDLKPKNKSIDMEDKNTIARLYKRLPLDFGGNALRLDSQFIKKGCCTQSFLKGVFLICGSISDPMSDYHLEFASNHKYLCDDLMYLLFKLNFEPKITKRRNTNVVYFKDSEYIEDFLNFIGATGAALSLMEVKVERDLRNNINRVVNCETANISKTVNASAQQVEAIEKIEGKLGLDTLPEGLEEVARARLKNPDSSLAELCLLVGGNLSRSGINHRMHRLMQIAKELENE